MILFALGKNKIGIVDEVTSFLFKHNANILDSCMSVMGGQFSITCLFSCSEEFLTQISKNIGNLEKSGLSISLHEVDTPAPVEKEAGLPIKLEVISMDHPGIVQNVVHILKNHEVSIFSLDTQLKTMPHTGTPMFDLNLEASIPADNSISKLKEELYDLASEMNLDILFK